MYTDTHTHLYDERLVADNDGVNRAIQAGVTRLYMPNCDSGTIAGMLEIADKWPQHCFAMMGLHPTYVKENYKEELTLVTEWLAKRPFAGVGEVGLDYYWDKTFVAQQKEALEYQVDLALQYDLPVILHTREAHADTVEIIGKKQNGKLRGIFHCFGGTLAEAQQVIDLDFYLGIGGVVTYSKTLPDVIKQLPLERIVLETDAPYLAPVPYRGKRNESSYIPVIAHKIAEIKGITAEEVARVTTENAGKVFGF